MLERSEYKLTSTIYTKSPINEKTIDENKKLGRTIFVDNFLFILCGFTLIIFGLMIYSTRLKLGGQLNSLQNVLYYFGLWISAGVVPLIFCFLSFLYDNKKNEFFREFKSFVLKACCLPLFGLIIGPCLFVYLAYFRIVIKWRSLSSKVAKKEIFQERKSEDEIPKWGRYTWLWIAGWFLINAIIIAVLFPQGFKISTSGKNQYTEYKSILFSKKISTTLNFDFDNSNTTEDLNDIYGKFKSNDAYLTYVNENDYLASPGAIAIIIHNIGITNKEKSLFEDNPITIFNEYGPTIMIDINEKSRNETWEDYRKRSKEILNNLDNIIKSRLNNLGSLI